MNISMRCAPSCDAKGEIYPGEKGLAKKKEIK